MADWFRWWHGTVTDPKFMWVARHSGRPLSEVIAVWAALLETASNGETRGNVSCFDSVSYDCLMGLDDGICDRIIAAMTDKGIIDGDGNLTGWERRQPKREDQTSAESRAKSSTERVREYRDRMKQRAGVTDETAVKRSETQETARGDKSREEVNPLPSVGGAGGAQAAEGDSGVASPAAPPPPAAPRSQRGTRLSADWRLPKAWGEWALTEHPTWDADHIRRVADTFRDFWQAKAGREAVKLDWEATWRNWVRREPPLKAPSRATTADQLFAGCE